MKIDNSEIKRILEMHNKLNPKRVLLEQANNVETELQRIIDTGCIKDGKIVRMKSSNPKYQFAIKKESKKNPGKFRYFYVDYTAAEFENGKPKVIPGKWRCDEKKIRQEIENYKKTGDGGGWMEYDEAVKSNTISWSNEDTYEKKPYNGVFLYRAKQRAGQTPLTEDQLAYVKPYLDAKWLLPSDPKLTGPDKDLYERVVVPGSQQAFGGQGIIMYQPTEDIKLRQSDIISKAETAIASRSFSKKDCKDFIRQYWEMYKVDGSNSRRQPEERLKTAAQMCVRQHYGDYSGFGDKFNKMMDALTGRIGEYDNFPAPLTKSPWRLLPKGYQ